MAWNPKSSDRPPGEWYEYSAGMDYRGWVLECPPLFHVHIVSQGGKYSTTFNGSPLATPGNLKAARAAAEAEIVRRVRVMLPSYRAVFARFEARAETSNVTPLRPPKDEL